MNVFARYRNMYILKCKNTTNLFWGGRGGQISATWQVEQEMYASQNMPVYINYQTV